MENKAPSKGRLIKFEVVGKHAAWRQFGRIKSRLSEELSLSDRIGDKAVVTSAPVDREVYFTPYHDSGSHVGENKIRVSEGEPDVWLIRTEDSSDGDYNDYIVRASIIDDAEKLGVVE